MGKRTKEEKVFYGVEERLASVREEEEEIVSNMIRRSERVNMMV